MEEDWRERITDAVGLPYVVSGLKYSAVETQSKPSEEEETRRGGEGGTAREVRDSLGLGGVILFLTGH